MGSEVAGEIVGIGKNVTEFKVNYTFYPSNI